MSLRPICMWQCENGIKTSIKIHQMNKINPFIYKWLIRGFLQSDKVWAKKKPPQKPFRLVLNRIEILYSKWLCTNILDWNVIIMQITEWMIWIDILYEHKNNINALFTFKTHYLYHNMFWKPQILTPIVNGNSFSFFADSSKFFW